MANHQGLPRVVDRLTRCCKECQALNFNIFPVLNWAQQLLIWKESSSFLFAVAITDPLKHLFSRSPCIITRLCSWASPALSPLWWWVIWSQRQPDSWPMWAASSLCPTRSEYPGHDRMVSSSGGWAPDEPLPGWPLVLSAWGWRYILTSRWYLLSILFSLSLFIRAFQKVDEVSYSPEEEIIQSLKAVSDRMVK